MSEFTIALLQMIPAEADPRANLLKGEMFCRQAAAMGADLALFPEMWNIGYTFPDPGDAQAVEDWKKLAIDQRDPFVRRSQSLAQELNMAIAITYLECWPGAPRNTLALIDRRGEIVLTYAKLHTCEFDREVLLTPGEDFYVCELDAARGPVKIGAMICFDREFPESARILMLKGAEVILTPNACGLEQLRLGQFQARAYENLTAMAMTNYAAPKENGHSVVYDGMPFPNQDDSSSDMLVVQAGTEEGVFLAKINLKRLREYRQREVWGNAYRHPRRYAALVDAAVLPPFVRKNASR